MIQHLRPALVLLTVFTAFLGIAYPLAMTAFAQFAFPEQANGSLLKRDGVFVGSRLIGQNFASDRYFQPRPSATSAPDPADASKTVDAPYNAANSSGSNLGPLSQKLMDRVKADIEARGHKGTVTADAVTTSASGLDPHISPDNALSQIERVAKARNLPETRLQQLVTSHIEPPIMGFIGERVVNVLKLNLALDAL